MHFHRNLDAPSPSHLFRVQNIIGLADGPSRLIVADVGQRPAWFGPAHASNVLLERQQARPLSNARLGRSATR